MEASACAWQACSAVWAFFSAGAAMAVVAESSSEKMTINRMVSSLLNMSRRRPAVEDGLLAVLAKREHLRPIDMLPINPMIGGFPAGCAYATSGHAAEQRYERAPPHGAYPQGQGSGTNYSRS